MTQVLDEVEESEVLGLDGQAGQEEARHLCKGDRTALVRPELRVY